MLDLTREQSEQFAQMILAGASPTVSASYFLPDGTEEMDQARAGRAWIRKRAVVEATERLQGGAWLTMPPDQRLKLALDKHYNEMAFFLYSNNYSDLEGSKKTKADTAREALEKKVAGTAGQADPLAKFYEDLVAGRIKKSPSLMPPVAAA